MPQEDVGAEYLADALRSLLRLRSPWDELPSAPRTFQVFAIDALALFRLNPSRAMRTDRC